MSNLETAPVETECHAGPASAAAEVEVIEPRLVPLGGPRAMPVRRTLPARGRSLIGPWCFLDHYGPNPVERGRGMDVPPHPHTGLQTVTWLFAGEVEHRDSLGSVQEIRPGQLNLMTAGHGIAHSEVSLPATRVMHGVQLWVALPEDSRHGEAAFEHHGSLPVVELPGAQGCPGGSAVVVMGSVGGVSSAATTFSPLVAAQVDLPAGASVDVPVEESFEHGVLADTGRVAVEGTAVPVGAVAYAAPGRAALRVTASGPEPARVVVLGGVPFGEDILMWWNFVGRTHEEVVQARTQWQAGLAAGSERFGRVEGYPGRALPAPDLPAVRLVPRSKR